MVLLRKFGWCKKDLKLRKLFFKFEVNKIILKSLLSSSLYSIKNKLYFVNLLSIISKMSSISLQRTFCLISYHGRSVFRQFKMSRHFSKKYASMVF